MSRRRGQVAGLARVGLVALVTLAVVVALPRVASAATTLSVFPSSGPAGASFTATFSDQAGPECFAGGLTVTFHWRSLRFPSYGTATIDGSSCTAALTAPPPGIPPPGTYDVWARMCIPSAMATSCHTASSRYTIIQPPPPTTTTTTSSTTTTTTRPPPPPTTTTTTTTTTLAPTTTTTSTTSTSTTTTTTTVAATTTTTTTTLPIPAPPSPGDDVSDFVAATPGPGDTSTAGEVIITNLLLTLLLLLLLGTTSAVFNNTMDANRFTIYGWFASWRRGWERLTGGKQLSPRARVGVILILTALIYGFLSPDFGLDRASLLLFGAMVAGIGLLTYLSEGGAVWFATRRLGVPAGVRVHIGALFAAVVCVVVSRILEFEPGILYGFIASAVVLTPAALDRRQAGQTVFFPAIFVLGFALLAWAGLGWVRSNGGSPVAESMLAVLFVGGVEGIMYSMIPLTFMDGRAVLEWQRTAWLVVAGAATFMFWQLIVNPDLAYLDAFRESAIRLVLGIAVGFALITAAAWGFFRWKGSVSPGLQS